MSYNVSIGFVGHLPEHEVKGLQKRFYVKAHQWLEADVDNGVKDNMDDVNADALMIDQLQKQFKFKSCKGVDCLIYYTDNKQSDTCDALIDLLVETFDDFKTGCRYWRSGESCDDASIRDGKHDLPYELEHVFEIPRGVRMTAPQLLL